MSPGAGLFSVITGAVVSAGSITRMKGSKSTEVTFPDVSVAVSVTSRIPGTSAT